MKKDAKISEVELALGGGGGDSTDSTPQTQTSKGRRTLQIAMLSISLVLSVMAFTFNLKETFGRTYSHGVLSVFVNSYISTTTTHEGGIKWTSCGENLECGRFSVPLDYFNANSGNASLSVIRYLATNKTAKLGTLFTNPGGPGGSGVQFVSRVGKQLSDVVNGRYDIVSWDPRGINGTIPRVECFGSQTEQDIAGANTHKEVPLEAGNLTHPLDLEVFKLNVKTADAQNKMFASLCQERSGGIMKYVSTATVVRDLVALHDALEGDIKPIDYWGFSYGTIVGSYLVNMFPDRVGRIIIDGVVDPEIWANKRTVLWTKVFFSDTENVLGNFADECAKAGEERCSLATLGETRKDILGRLDVFIEKLYKHPTAVPHASRPGILTSGMIKAMLFAYMYRPRDWPELATNLALALAGNGSSVVEYFLKDIQLDTSVPASTIGSNAAVTCTDSPDYSEFTEDEIFEEFFLETTALQSTSPHFAGLGALECHNMRVKAAERFTGPFNHTLTNEILIIGNTADPITPLRNAISVNKMLSKSSRLIVHQGSGHCSLALASVCTARTIRGYLLDGDLPPSGLLCPVDEKLFPTEKNPGFNRPEWLRESSLVDSPDDIKLLESIRHLGKELGAFTLRI